MAKLYGEGVAWIARNDEPTETDQAAVSQQISVCLLADLFGLDEERVAADVVRYRRTGAEVEARRRRGTSGEHLPSVEAALAVLLPERR